MGREIIVDVVRKTNPDQPTYIVEEDIGYTCGRDDATNWVAMMCNDNEDATLIFAPESNLSKQLLTELDEYGDADQHEFDYADMTWDDLRVARRNASSVEEFKKFSSMMKEIYEWQKDWFSRAQSIAKDIRDAIAYIEREHDDDLYVQVICSE